MSVPFWVNIIKVPLFHINSVNNPSYPVMDPILSKSVKNFFQENIQFFGECYIFKDTK